MWLRSWQTAKRTISCESPYGLVLAVDLTPMSDTDDEHSFFRNRVDHAIVTDAKLVKTFERPAQRNGTKVSGGQRFFHSVDDATRCLAIQATQIPIDGRLVFNLPQDDVAAQPAK